MSKVVVAMTTYNLEKYIRQALDSVLMQETEFDYKIIVADDNSKDDTTRILLEYKKRYPEKIELILSETNKGSLINSNQIFDGLKSEYFSFLDGDDYWIGKNHLQKQVNFLDSHPEYMLCGGNTQYLRNDVLSELVIKKSQCGKTYDFNSMIDGVIPFVHTSALLLRNTIFCNGLPKCYKDVAYTFENCALRGEDFRRIIHLELGPMYIFDDVLSVYRIHSHGVWQGASSAKRVIESAIGWNFYRKYFGDKYGKYFSNGAKDSYKNMIKTLICDYDFISGYNLNQKESELLIALLNDLKTEGVFKKNKNLFDYIRKKIIQFLY